ncbi:MAG: tyrosine-type recombinase/integrase [Rhodanobacteraceae bacterium]
MSDPSRVRITGPLARFADGFAAELLHQGYRRNAAADQLRLVAHLSRWLAGRHLGAKDLVFPVQARFLAARRSQGYVLWLSPKALAPFMGYLRGLGLAPTESAATPSPVEQALERFQNYLLETRGLATTTARNYVSLLRPFVATRDTPGGLEWASLTGAEVNAFVGRACRDRSRGTASLLVVALRSLLRHLHVAGLLARPLAETAPAVAYSRLAGLPRHLEPGGVERLLGACDRRTHAGRRDFAMLMFLAHLGLRAGEVRALRLDDIDWRAGELSVRGKGNRMERLPLPSQVGQAVVAYLRRGRPATARGRTVFVRLHAPHGSLSSTAVTNVVARAAARAGLAHATAHQLRHTLATRMVRAGASLPEVAQVLRHRRLVTTAIYAKVDREGLRQLARVWPGDLP